MAAQSYQTGDLTCPRAILRLDHAMCDSRCSGPRPLPLVSSLPNQVPDARLFRRYMGSADRWLMARGGRQGRPSRESRIGTITGPGGCDHVEMFAQAPRCVVVIGSAPISPIRAEPIGCWQYVPWSPPPLAQEPIPLCGKYSFLTRLLVGRHIHHRRWPPNRRVSS